MLGNRGDALMTRKREIGVLLFNVHSGKHPGTWRWSEPLQSVVYLPANLRDRDQWFPLIERKNNLEGALGMALLHAFQGHHAESKRKRKVEPRGG